MCEFIRKMKLSQGVSLLLTSSKAVKIPQNLPEARKQENLDGDTSLISLSQVVLLTPLANSKNLFLSSAKMCLKETWGRSWQAGKMEDRICWSRAMVQAAKVTLYQCLGNTALRHQRIRCQKPTMSWQKVTGRERNETVFINSGSLCPSSRTPPPLPSGWGHWHVSWWAWNSPSSLVHTNGPLNPYTNGKTSK